MRCLGGSDTGSVRWFDGGVDPSLSRRPVGSAVLGADTHPAQTFLLLHHGICTRWQAGPSQTLRWIRGHQGTAAFEKGCSVEGLTRPPVWTARGLSVLGVARTDGMPHIHGLGVAVPRFRPYHHRLCALLEQRESKRLRMSSENSEPSEPFSCWIPFFQRHPQQRISACAPEFQVDRRQDYGRRSPD